MVDRAWTEGATAGWGVVGALGIFFVILLGAPGGPVLVSATAAGVGPGPMAQSSVPLTTGASCTGGATTQVSSGNWGGYAAQSCLSSPASHVVTDVQGSWVEPTVHCASGQTAYAAFWVGIDGYSSSSVEQLGTDSDCASGSPSYYAWYEMYPRAPVTLGLTIHAGDAITAQVRYTGSAFTLSLTDTTSGHSFSTTKTYSAAARSSAEWIAEAPASGSGILPLADFGTVTFTSCSATLSGTTGSISSSAWQNAEITQKTGSTLQDKPGSLGASGSSFTMTWKHS